MSCHAQSAIDAMPQSERRRLAHLLGNAETGLLQAVADDLQAAIAQEDAVISAMEFEHAGALAAETAKHAERFPLPLYEKGNSTHE